VKQSDLKNIPSKGFTKTWWQGKRPLRAKGSGVGKALVAWNAAGMPPGGSVAKLESANDFKAAFAACNALEKALDTAMDKVRRKAHDTVDGIKVYKKELMKHWQALLKGYTQRVEKFKAKREALVKYCANAQKRMEVFATEAKKINSILDKAINAAIDEAPVDAQTASLSTKTDKLVELADKNLHGAQKKYNADGIHVNEERSKDNASAFGVMAKQNSELQYLVDKVVTHMDKSTMRFEEVKELTKATKEARKRVRVLLKTGSQSIERSAAQAKATADGASKTVKAIEAVIDKVQGRFTQLDRLVEAGLDRLAEARPGTLSIGEFKTEIGGLQDLIGAVETKATQLFKKLETNVKECTKRIPKGHRNEPTVKWHVDTYVKSLRQARSSRTDFGRRITEAKKLASKILSAK